MTAEEMLIAQAHQMDTLNTIAVATERTASAAERIALALEKLLEKQFPEVDYNAPFDTPERCSSHDCSYHRDYLIYGPPELTHEAYHRVQRQHIDHTRQHHSLDRECHQCTSLEKRLRA